MNGGDALVELPAGVRPLTLEDPSVVGRYRLLGRIGVGGMGVVYLGHSRDSAPVAVKTLHPHYVDVEDLRRRFVTEARYASRVTEGTARVIEDASDHARPYIVTEFIEGPPLSRVIDEDGPLPEPRLREIAAGIAVALAAIHRAGLVHRDLKPENVLLARGGPRVIDFGIAHEADAGRGHTQAGIIMGSPGWIAPERLLGHTAVAASDMFSWGCLVVFAASGRHPYGSGRNDELGARIVNGTPDLGALSGPLRDLVAAALDRDPAMRPCAAEIARILRGGGNVVRILPLRSRAGARSGSGAGTDARPGVGLGAGTGAGRDGMADAGSAGPAGSSAAETTVVHRIRPPAHAVLSRMGAVVAWSAVGAAVAAVTIAVAGPDTGADAGPGGGAGRGPGTGGPVPTLGAEAEREQPRVVRFRRQPGATDGGSPVPVTRSTEPPTHLVARSAPGPGGRGGRGGRAAVPAKDEPVLNQPLNSTPAPGNGRDVTPPVLDPSTGTRAN